jgi:Ser/Thr protein kinase RdoA (MazF antagonist)
MSVSASGAARAVAAAIAAASELGAVVEHAVVLQASNRFTVRLLPVDVVARVAHPSHDAMQLEVDLAARLADTGSPVAALDARFPARVQERDGFAISFWTYHEPLDARALAAADYADALLRLHQGMQQVDLVTPHFLDRVRAAATIVRARERTPALGAADRDLLTSTFSTVTDAIAERGVVEQVLHGEPHPGNVLDTEAGPLFIDLETACRGPVEFDLAHVPEAVGAHYPNADQTLLGQCRILVLAMVAAWRLEPGDELPGGERLGAELLAALRAGPPYPTLDTFGPRSPGPVRRGRRRPRPRGCDRRGG